LRSWVRSPATLAVTLNQAVLMITPVEHHHFHSFVLFHARQKKPPSSKELDEKPCLVDSPL